MRSPFTESEAEEWLIGGTKRRWRFKKIWLECFFLGAVFAPLLMWIRIVRNRRRFSINIKYRSSFIRIHRSQYIAGVAKW